MKRILAIIAALAFPVAASAQDWSTVEEGHVRRTASLTLNAVACTAPGGASCTIIGPSLNVGDYSSIAITLRVSGGNPVDNVLISFSPNNANWEIYDSTAFAGLAASAIKSLEFTGNARKYMRIEARAAAATTVVVDVHLSKNGGSGFKPSSSGAVRTDGAVSVTAPPPTPVCVHTGAHDNMWTAPMVGRKSFGLQNQGPNSIWCTWGPTDPADPTIGGGWEVASKGTLIFDCTDVACAFAECIATAADQAAGTGCTMVWEAR